MNQEQERLQALLSIQVERTRLWCLNQYTFPDTEFEYRPHTLHSLQMRNYYGRGRMATVIHECAGCKKVLMRADYRREVWCAVCKLKKAPPTWASRLSTD